MSSDKNNSEQLPESQIVDKANQVVINYFLEKNIDINITSYQFIPKYVAPHVGIYGHIKEDPDKTFVFLVDYTNYQIDSKLTKGFSLPDDKK